MRGCPVRPEPAAEATLALGTFRHLYHTLPPPWAWASAAGALAAALGARARALSRRLDGERRERRALEAERLSAESALRRGETRFRALVENASDGFNLVDRDGAILYSGPSNHRLLGYEERELVGQDGFALVHPEDLEPMRRKFAEVLAAPGATLESEMRVRHRDGSWRWMDTRARNLLHDRAVGAIVVNYRDITARKEGQAALRASEATLSLIYNHVSDLMLLLEVEEEDGEAHYRLVTANASFLAAARAGGDLVGKRIDEFLPEEVRGPYLEKCRAAVSSGRVQHFENTSGTLRRALVLETRLTPITGGDGKVRHLLWVSRDVTETRRAEALLRENEARYRALAETIPVGIWQVDAAGGALYLNPVMRALLELEPGDPPPADARAFFTPPSWRALVREMARARAGAATAFEVCLVGKRGRRAQVLVSGAPLPGSEGGTVGVIGTFMDLGELRRAEEEARRHQSKLRRLAEANMLGILEWHGDGRITEANEAFLRILGYAREDLEAGRLDWRALTPPEQVHLDQAALQEIRSTGRCLPFEKEYLRKDGGRVAVLVAGACVDGDPDTGMAYVLDISHRKRTEQALRQAQRELQEANRALEAKVSARTADLERANAELRRSRDQFDAILRGADDAITATDPQGNLIFANPKATRVLGFSDAGEALGAGKRRIMEQFEMLDAEGLPLPVERLPHRVSVATRAPSALTLRYRVRADGSEHWNLVKATPIFGEDGAVHMVINISSDITDLKRAEAQITALNGDLRRRARELEAANAELRRSRDQLDAILQGVEDAILAQDPSGRLVFANHAAARMLRFPSVPALLAAEPGAIGAGFEVLDEAGAPRPGPLPFLSPRSRPETGKVVRYRFRDEAGDFWSYYKAAPILDEGGGVRLLIYIITDITELKRAEGRIRALNRDLLRRARELEAANRELEAFSYSISHDLRAPLRAMDGYSRILRDDFAAALPGDAERLLRMIQENSRIMGKLIDDLLRFSRLGRHPLERREAAPAAMVEEARRSLAAELQGREVEWDIGPLPPCRADPALLQQVFLNLLSNAAKFSRGRKPAVIQVGHCVKDGQSTYWVRDNGVGFDMLYLPKLFGVFQRLHHAEEYEGTGVGLAIVQRIVQRHGGKVWAESEPGGGAAFYFTLEGSHGDEPGAG